MSEDTTNITPKITSIKKEKDKSWNIDYGFLFGAIGVASAIGTLYYARRDDKRQIKMLESIKESLNQNMNKNMW